jgi:hypothetical protein
MLGPLVSVLAATGAAAQVDCAAEIEPNDRLEDAQVVQGAACVQGSIAAGEQDGFVWSVPAGDAAPWELGFDGGYPTARVTLRAIEKADGAAPSEGSEMLRLDVPQGAFRGRSGSFLVAPGDYLATVIADGPVDYQLRFTARVAGPREREPNDSAESATPLSADTALSGDSGDDPDYFGFSLSGADARRHWEIGVSGPPGAWLTADLLDSAGRVLVSASGRGDRPLQIGDLGLAAGDYFVRLAPSPGQAIPFEIRLEPGGPRLPGREDEPNDVLADAGPLAIGRPVGGRLDRGGDIDVYALDVPEALSGKLLTVAIKSKVERTLCITDDGGAELQCRRGAQAELAGLSPAPGRYGITVGGAAAVDQPYTLTARPVGNRRPATEAEPNETFALANRIEPGVAMAASLSGQDVDVFVLKVEGPPQLWTFDAAGAGVRSVVVTDFAQSPMGSGESGEGDDGATAGDVFLLPGEYWVKVSGSDGRYVLTASPAGQPDPNAEREPNDTDAQAHRLEFGVPRTGRLSDSTDRDIYRFSLFAPDHVVLKVEGDRDDIIGVELEWGYPSLKQPRGSAAGEPWIYDAFLDPGDYLVRLRSDRRSSAPYRIELRRGDPFILPADLEPNDVPGQAQSLPASMAVDGRVASYGDVDWFALPMQKQGARMTLRLTGKVEPSLVDDAGAAAGSWDSASGVLAADLEGRRLYRLRIAGDGPYAFDVDLDGAPRPTATGAPAVAMTMTLAQPAVAAFWIRGQRVHGTLDIVNSGPATELAIDLVSSHFAYRPEIANGRVAVAAGGQARVPFEVAVAPDAWQNQRVDIVARASAADGVVTARATLAADPDVLPVNQENAFPLPLSLLGGFNVAGSRLGGVIGLPEGDASGEDPAVLQDGLVGDARIGAFAIRADMLPYELTARFGTQEPWMIAGITLHPQAEGRLYPAEQIKDFDLLLSQDGETFEPALSGSVSMLPVEQAFVLDHPVAARGARLRLKSNHADNAGKVGLGEWKVIAVPGSRAGLSADIADWTRGGHVVWSSLVIGSTPQDERAMLGSDRSIPVKLRAGARPEWVIGFHENRAAQIVSLEWLAADPEPDRHAFDRLNVAISTDGPFGPWREMGTWTLATEGVSRLDLPAPSWARFVRFTVPQPSAVEATWPFPRALHIQERASGADYLSILGEWGQFNRSAIFEATSPIPPLATAELATSQRPSRDRAAPLVPGDEVSGAVRLNEVEEWFSVDVPEGMNRLTFTASGEPTVDVDVALERADGTPVPLAVLPSAADWLGFEARVEGGQRYFAQVHEPPRSVAIAFDTSLSLAAFTPIIRNAMAAFAMGAVPGREFVNFMNFASPFILEAWSDQPWILEGALRGRPAPDQTDSSDLQATLASILDAFAVRRGVRAAIVVTDAETPGFEVQPQNWARLASLRPRIFAAHIGAGKDPWREKQLMQDLAAVNGGYYASARTQAEMDVVAERAAAWLRRPTRYRLVAKVRNEVPPLPGTLQVAAALAAAEAPRPAARPEDPPAAARPAVELILDASGSMLQRLHGRRRIEIAREVLSRLATDTLTPGQLLALRVFGDDRPESCETRLAVPLGPLEPKSLVGRIRKITPKNLARTPIAASLRAVSDDLADASGPRTVILVTDGEETCGGDPEAEIAGLRARGFDVRVNIVGFAVDDAGLKDDFARWAEVGGGRYFDTADAGQLDAAVKAAVALPYAVRDETGVVVASGTVGGPPLTLAPAIYRIEIGGEGGTAIDGVAVTAGQETRVDVPG